MQAFMGAGFAANGGGGGNFNFEIPDRKGGRFRLGNEMTFTWNSPSINSTSLAKVRI
jgi:hypothetical protein